MVSKEVLMKYFYLLDKLRTGVLEAILNTLEISFRTILDQENAKNIICNDSTYLNTEVCFYLFQILIESTFY